MKFVYFLSVHEICITRFFSKALMILFFLENNHDFISYKPRINEVTLEQSLSLMRSNMPFILKRREYYGTYLEN